MNTFLYLSLLTASAVLLFVITLVVLDKIRNRHLVEISEEIWDALKDAARAGSPKAFDLKVQYYKLPKRPQQWILPSFAGYEMAKAAAKGGKKMLEHMVNKYKLDPTMTNRLNENILFDAVRYADEAMIDWLITTFRFDPQATNHLGETLLFPAVACRKPSFITWLVSTYGMDPLHTASTYQETPLFTAILHRDTTFIAWLVETFHMDPTHERIGKESILFPAAAYRSTDVFEWLVTTYHLNPYALNEKEENVLFMAARHQHLSFVRWLHSHYEFNLFHTSYEGNQAMHVARDLMVNHYLWHHMQPVGACQVL